MSREGTSSCPNSLGECPHLSELNALKAENQRLQELVRTDVLTGLFNRRHLNYCLDQELERTCRSGQATTLLIVDIDHFKSVNDNYGHLVGDKALQLLAATIKNTVRKLDIACRYGGEEFAIILPASTNAIGARVAERLRKNVENNTLTLDDVSELKITISIGIATSSKGQNLAPKQLISSADEQLYKAKESGRNRVCGEQDNHSETEVSAEEKAALFGPS
ncbi:GGDEF domain-containing protein [Agaribacterium sp. ZY112]|uniref:GGDEF domain-containing protein n=1 Tax=Agaribacterium sp. ZY112 TaxID=3233574 RepID=UPI003525AEAB